MTSNRRLQGAALAALLVLGAGGAGAERVADLNSSSANGRMDFADLGGQTVFGFHSPDTGWEPWISDGTLAGTRLLADLQPGPCSSRPHSFVAADGQAFFVLQDGDTGRELWRTDGTEAGTRFVSENAPSFSAGDDQTMAAMGSRLAYVSELEPWVSDGNPGDTLRLDSPVQIVFVVVAGDLAYFENPWGPEVVVHDGLSPAPLDVLDFPARVEAMVPLSARMAIRDLDQVLWLSEGTQATTVSLGCCFGQPASSIEAVGGTELYHVGLHGLPRPGPEPFVWDAVGGSRLLKDIEPNDGIEPEGSWPREFVAAGSDRVFFTAERLEGVSGRRELFVSDGSEAGTLQLTDAPFGATEPFEITALGTGAVFLAGADSPSGLWVSDGTAAGTRNLLEADPLRLILASELTAVGSRVFFRARDSQGEGVFVTDATEPGTLGLATLALGAGSSEPGPFVVYRGAVWFPIVDAAGEAWLARTDGTEAGTEVAGPQGARDLIVWDDRLFIVAGDLGRGFALWVSDGTPGGLRPLSGARFPQPEPAVVGDRLIFGISDRLYRVEPGSNDSFSYANLPGAEFLSPAVLGGRAVFVGDDDEGDIRLWVTDGTDPGSEQLALISPGVSDFQQIGLTAAAGRAWFGADGGTTGVELWASDGTIAGTGLILDIHPAGDSLPRDFAELGGLVYFSADDGANGRELWHSDGTPGGTTLAVDVAPGGSGEVADLVSTAGRLFFTAADGANGRELWVSDGTPAGTQMVVDLRAGAEGSDPSELVATDDGVAFVADDGVAGRSLWTSDGTPSGTLVRSTPAPGAECTEILHLTPIGDELIFAANDGEAGVEPWVTGPLTLPAPPSNLTVSDRFFFLRTALAQMHLPNAIFGPYPNASGCGRTRVAADARIPADGPSLDAGISIPDSGGVLMLFELAEWCGCSNDPAEPPPADSSEVEATLLIKKSGDELLATSLPGSAGQACP